jgi:hypothetical protein
MKVVKRCDDNVIALLIILSALVLCFAFQKIIFSIISQPSIKRTSDIPGIHRKPLDPEGGRDNQGSR